MKLKHHYRVDLLRRVRCPETASAYICDTRLECFPFGKGFAYPNGKAAKAAAIAFASNLLDEASSVSIWKMNGGSGTGTYLKDTWTLFDKGWPK